MGTSTTTAAEVVKVDAAIKVDKGSPDSVLGPLALSAGAAPVSVVAGVGDDEADAAALKPAAVRSSAVEITESGNFSFSGERLSLGLTPCC